MSRPFGCKNKKPRVKSNICKHGHNKDIAGRVSNGQCAECIRITQIIGIQNPRVQFCPKGHKIAVVGRNKSGHCKGCERVYKEINAERLKLINKQWYFNNIDKIEKWKKEHPESIKEGRIKQQTNRNLRVVAWTDWDNIKEFYKNMPIGMTEDHIIPLQGKLVSGLHVSWNLQYLTHPENSSKFNKVNLNQASEWYGKILEKEGLK